MAFRQSAASPRNSMWKGKADLQLLQLRSQVLRLQTPSTLCFPKPYAHNLQSFSVISSL